MPRVSVIIPTYNCAAFLKRSIGSVFAQTYKDYEILVADDGSTDDTKDVVERFFPEVTYLYQKNRGVSAARNHAVAEGSGELIAYLDADDMWYPKKLERQVAYMDEHHECGIVHSEISVIDEEDRIVHLRFNEETKRTVPQGHCLYDLLKQNHIQTLTVIERRQSFEGAGAFDERLPVAQDYLHWVMIAAEGYTVGYLPEPLGKYRWRAGSLMGSKLRLLEDYVRICDILLEEREIEDRHGVEAAAILRRRSYEMQLELAYLDRTEGRRNSASRRLAGLIKEQPCRLELYVELLKAYLGPALNIA